MAATILVVGFGNTLMGDDGIGPLVIRELAQRTLPAEMRVVECGSDSLVLPSIWNGEKEVWLVDALVRRNDPGTVYTLTHDQVMSIPQRHATVHHLSLPEGLRWINLAYPEMAIIKYRLWGIEPAGLDLGENLSPDVQAAVEIVADEILNTYGDAV